MALCTSKSNNAFIRINFLGGTLSLLSNENFEEWESFGRFQVPAMLTFSSCKEKNIKLETPGVVA